jgi:hypothetical protein
MNAFFPSPAAARISALSLCLAVGSVAAQSPDPSAVHAAHVAAGKPGTAHVATPQQLEVERLREQARQLEQQMQLAAADQSSSAGNMGPMQSQPAAAMPSSTPGMKMGGMESMDDGMGQPMAPMAPMQSAPAAPIPAGGGMDMMRMMEMMQPMMRGGAMMGAKAMGGMGSPAAMATPSALPGFPGQSHLYHIGATDFFLDHPQHISLTVQQQQMLAQHKQQALLAQSQQQVKLDAAEQALWQLTGAEQPQIGEIEKKAREIERLQGDQRIAFIRSVGEAAQVLTVEQRQQLMGLAVAQPASPAPPMADPAPMAMPDDDQPMPGGMDDM